MNEYLNGYERKEVTFKASANVVEGATVTYLNKSTMSLAAKEQNFCAVCASLRDGYGSYVLNGYVTVSYTDTAPTLGYTKLAGNGKGGVMVSESGRYILVADIDKDNLTCGIIL